MAWVNAVVQGILLGGLYALLATGLSLTFGVMRIVNLAQGDLAILAAYFCVSITDAFGWSPLLSLVVVLPAAFVLGWILQRVMFDRIVGVDPAFQIVATFGLGIVIQNLLLEWYSADNRRLDVGRLAGKSIEVTDKLAIGWIPLITFGVGVGVLAVLSAVPPPHDAGAGLPGDLRRPRGGAAHGHRQPAHLRHRPRRSRSSPWRWPACSSGSARSSTRRPGRPG